MPRDLEIQQENLVDETSTYRWVVYGLFVTCNTTGFMIANTIGVLLPSIVRELDLTPVQQGLFTSAPFWANLILMVPISLWISRYSPKLIVTSSMFLGTVALLIQSWGPTFILLWIGRLFFGISMIMREPARSLLIRQWLPQREINFAGGISNLFFGVIVSGGLITTPLILNFYDDDWRPVMNCFALLLLAVGFVWVVLGRERTVSNFSSEDRRTEGWTLVRNAVRIREIWLAGFGLIGTLIAFSSFNGFFPLMALDVYSLSVDKSGLMVALYVLPGGLSGVLIGYYVKDVRGRDVVLVCAGLLLGTTYFGMTLIGSYPVLLVLAFVNGLAWGFFPILYMVPFHIKKISPREVAVAVSLVVAISSLGAAIGPIIVGYLQESTGSLQMAIRIVSLSPLTLVPAGILINRGIKPENLH